jgi:hypothetical protein
VALGEDDDADEEMLLGDSDFARGRRVIVADDVVGVETIFSEKGES